MTGNQCALTYFIGSEYMLPDDIAHNVAELCIADGISTWQQWADLDYTEKNSYINDVQVAYQPVPRK